MSETVHIVGFSGGIDSQACARWVLNREGPESVVLMNTDAGGNEHPMTVEFVQTYSREVHPVIVVAPIVADMLGRGLPQREALGLRDSDPLTFPLMAQIKKRFPSRKAQFCTHHLKIEPQKRYIAEHFGDVEVIRYSGLRWDESPSRRKRWNVTQYDEYFDCELRCPVIDWTKQMCFDYVGQFGEPINQLYSLGFNRVGCAPCINSNKADIANWVRRSPEMIDKIREWEKQVGRTFFTPSAVPGAGLNFIDDVVEWSKTVHGGKQYSLDVLYEREACESAYGLCE